MLAALIGASLGVSPLLDVEDQGSLWIQGAQRPHVVRDTVAQERHKLPSDFNERLEFANDDGSLRIMAVVAARDRDVEAFVAQHTMQVHWYGDAPRFMALVDPDQMAGLLAAPFVTFLEPDYPVTWHLAVSAGDVHARGATAGDGVWGFDPTDGPMGALTSLVPGFDEPITGKGVTVAVADSGIDGTHRDFGGWDCAAGAYAPCDSRILTKKKLETVIEFGADPGDSLPTTDLASGHGTHVAGIIAGNGYYTRNGDERPDDYGGDGYVLGVAPEASLVSISNGDSQSAALGVAALQWILDHAQEYGIRVASNSWGCLGGCPYSPNGVEARVQRDLYRAGIVTVFAAGNDGGNDGGSSFSGDSQSPYVLSVASYDAASHRLAPSSSRGQRIAPLPAAATWDPDSEPVTGYRRPDLAAPGEFIYSAHNLLGGTSAITPRANTNDILGGGSNGWLPYTPMSGTSMAAPHVAGAAALLFDGCPAATPLDVMRALMVGADAGKLRKSTGTVTAEAFEVGYGALDVRAGLDWLLSTPACGGVSTSPSITITAPGASAEVTPGPTLVAGLVDRASPESPPALMAASMDASASSSTAYYFHHLVAPAHQADMFFVGGSPMTRVAPTSTEPSVALAPWSPDGTTPRTPYDANWQTNEDVSLAGQDVRLVWWANPPALATLSDSVWDLKLYHSLGNVHTQLSSTPAEGQVFPVPVGSDVIEFTYTFQDVTTPSAGRLTVLLDAHFGIPDSGHVIQYDAIDRPSRIEILAPENAPPTAMLTASPTSGPAPLPVTFLLEAADADGAITDWNLDFGDATPTAFGPGIPPPELVHTYEAPGAYLATLTVMDDLGATASSQVTVEAGDAGAFERVDVYLDDALAATLAVSTDLESPTADWSTTLDLAEGTHTLRAEWIDEDDSLLDSASISVTARTPGQALTITSPEEGTVFEATPIHFEGTYDTTAEPAGQGLAQSSSRPHNLDDVLDELAMLETPSVAGLRAQLAQIPGFLGLDATGDQSLAAYFAGPAGAVPPPPASWRLTIHENVKLEKAMHRFPPGTDVASSRSGPPVPDASTGIGPGSALLIESPEEGLLGCTANFVWQDRATDRYFLGAAGHCFLPVDRIATHGPSADYDPSGVRTWVCVEACEFGGLSGQIFTSFTAELGRVAYARQGPGFDLIGAGEDFGLVEIPAALHHLVRPEMPVWNGPTVERAEGFGEGGITLQYGHSLGFGETFLTQARAGISNLPWSYETGPWYSLHPSIYGDSGSAIQLAGATATAEAIEGVDAAGILTHIGVPFGLASGTFVHYAKAMAAQAGLDVRVVFEGETLDGGIDPDPTGPVARITSPTAGQEFDLAATSTIAIAGTAAFPAGGGSVPTTAWLRYDGGGSSCGAQSLRLVDGPDGGDGCTKTFGVVGGALGLADVYPADFDPVALAPGGLVTGKIYFGTQGADPASVRLVLRAGTMELGSQVAEFTHVAALGIGGFHQVDVGFPLDGLASGADLADLHFDIELQRQGVVQWVSHDDPASYLVLPFAAPADDGAVDVAIDDPTFSSTLAVTGTTSWTATWDVSATTPGTHTIYARARTSNQTQSAPSAVSVTLVGGGEGPWTLEVRVDDAQAQPVTNWTRLQTLADGSAGTWSFDWAPAAAADGAYTMRARLLREGVEQAEASRGVELRRANAAPQPQIAGPDSAGVNALVTFDGGGSWDPDGSITSYSWDFGDGETATGSVVSHRYSAPGAFLVTLVVEDDRGASSRAEHTIDVVNAAPTAMIQAPKSTPRQADVTLDGSFSSDVDGTITSFEWDFGDGATATGETVTHAWSSAGNFTLTLTVTDEWGATSTATSWIEVCQGKGGGHGKKADGCK